MVNFCCAYGCASSSDVNPNLIFHKFPDAVKDKERYLKWIDSIKRKDFKPSTSSKLCSLHFKPSDYDPPVICGPPRLKKNAVPSVFSFLDHLMPKKKVKERRIIERYILEPLNPQVPQEIQETTETTKEESHSTVGVQTTLTGIELTETLTGLRREKHCLQKQIQRRNRRLMQMVCKHCGHKNEATI